MTDALDLARAVLVILAAIAQAVMGNWPQLRKWQNTVPARSERLHLAIVPWEPFFAIWGVIFLASLGFAIWHALPGNLDDPLLRTLGWLAISAWTLNTAWEWHVPKRDIDWISVALIVTALVALLGAMAAIDRAGTLSGWRYWLGAAPLQLLAGWLSAAVWVNLGSTLKYRGVAERTGWQLALLLAAGGFGTVIAAWSGAPVYAAAVAWALIGIVVQNLRRDRNIVLGGTAAALAPIVLGAALL